MKSAVPRICLAYFAIQGIVLGMYAVLAPQHYFDNFPVGGKWVALDGPYNEHLMRDYGALNLALGAVAICALVYASRQLAIAVAVAEIVYNVPHVLYHVAHPSRLGDTTDQFGAIGGLLLNVVVAALLLFYVFNTRSQSALSS